VLIDGSYGTHYKMRSSYVICVHVQYLVDVHIDGLVLWVEVHANEKFNLRITLLNVGTTHWWIEELL